MRRAVLTVILVLAFTRAGSAAVTVSPTAVNVGESGATTAFLFYRGLLEQAAAEAEWCGALVGAAPAVGTKCDPATLFGRLPARFDLSTLNTAPGGSFSTFTDLMSVPASVARRARQAVDQGGASTFFYVRRFVSTHQPIPRPDEFVVVTCRLLGSGGVGAPFALTDVRIEFATRAPVLFIMPGEVPPPLTADLVYTGTGRLIGRWEVVLPGEELPATADLLTEASLPPDRRGLGRRYTQLERFNVFLPPAGRATLPGPDASRLPNIVDGLYLVLLRIEASVDNALPPAITLSNGPQRAGPVAGFPMPVVRYVVGGASSTLPGQATSSLRLVLPPENATMPAGGPVDFTWIEVSGARYYHLEVHDPGDRPVIAAMLPAGLATYRAPSYLKDKAGDGSLRWRVTALDDEGNRLDDSGWRNLRLVRP